jgi:predicted MarR family transcription regulator
MSTEDELPIFIRRHLGSVWALEILLLLRRQPQRAWTIADIVLDLRASSTLVTANLAKFEQSGLVVAESEGRYRYQPASPLMEALCAAVEEAYRERPVATINLISAPEERLQQLANAFRIGRDRP